MVAVVGKANDLARRLEQETQRRIVLAPFQAGSGVALGLALYDGDVFTRTVFLGFNDTHGIAIDEQHVIRRAGIGGVFTDRDA